MSSLIHKELNAANILIGYHRSSNRNTAAVQTALHRPRAFFPRDSRRLTSHLRDQFLSSTPGPHVTVTLDDQLSFDWLRGSGAVNMNLLFLVRLFSHAADLFEQMTVGRFVSKWLLFRNAETLIEIRKTDCAVRVSNGEDDEISACRRSASSGFVMKRITALQRSLQQG